MTTEFDITATLGSVQIGATGLTQIIQNVRTILATAKGTVPLDRDFGVDWKMVDKPVHVVRALATADIIAAIETYEPRVDVVRVAWDGSDPVQGIISPTVRIKIKDGVSL